MRVLVIDNFDSFTYNLVQALGALGAVVTVRRNDAITADGVLEMAPDRVVISPGPGGPADAGVSSDVIRAAAGRVPVLGVCLGHQCLAEVYGGRIVRAQPVHGKTSDVLHDGRGVFAGIASPMTVARYHSLVVDPATVSAELEVSARASDGLIMGLRHRRHSLEGMQFHPESFLTPEGHRMVRNFLASGGSA